MAQKAQPPKSKVDAGVTSASQTKKRPAASEIDDIFAKKPKPTSATLEAAAQATSTKQKKKDKKGKAKAAHVVDEEAQSEGTVVQPVPKKAPETVVDTSSAIEAYKPAAAQSIKKAKDMTDEEKKAAEEEQRFRDSRGTRKKTEDGLPIYDTAELKIGLGGESSSTASRFSISPEPRPPLSPIKSPDSTTSLPLARPVVPPLACMRFSPRPCVNQALVDALRPLRDYRFAEFGSQSPEAISYSTALSAIIATPFVIASGQEARQINKIGAKLAIKIDEFIATGQIKEAVEVLRNERFIALTSLMTVHGVGHTRAKELYQEGFRSAEQLRSTGKWEKEFRYHDDIQEKIPRREVESIHEFVRIQLDRIEPGAYTVLCGGYRRGKTASNDVDILITYPHQDGKERGILRRLVHRLEVKGLIPPNGVLTFSQPATLRTTRANKRASSFDSLDKALIIFKHPANGTTRKRDYYRRVDLIVAAWDNWGSALVGWTGGTQFERDLRIHAEHLGYKFDSGALRNRTTGDIVRTMTEKDVFRALKLKWIPPEMRNSDP
ncbi:DNA-directed DNA polymerase IV [Sporobolomyces koalae]|uniref:DNA-directed DNA polymerase IV n=1 Tax=Sporobolomyces koalae TaxID=500713 RepID=UPI0031788DA0